MISEMWTSVNNDYHSAFRTRWHKRQRWTWRRDQTKLTRSEKKKEKKIAPYCLHPTPRESYVGHQKKRPHKHGADALVSYEEQSNTMRSHERFSRLNWFPPHRENSQFRSYKCYRCEHWKFLTADTFSRCATHFRPTVSPSVFTLHFARQHRLWFDGASWWFALRRGDEICKVSKCTDVFLFVIYCGNDTLGVRRLETVGRLCGFMLQRAGGPGGSVPWNERRAAHKLLLQSITVS